MGGGLNGAQRLAQRPKSGAAPSGVMSTCKEPSERCRRKALINPPPIRPGTTKFWSLRRPWRLHYGDELPKPRIAFRIVGPEDAPVIAVLGGISAHRIVCGGRGLVARTGRPEPRNRYEEVPRARHRLSRRPRRQFGARPGRALSAVEFLRPGAGAARHHRSPGDQVPACHRRRLLRRHGGAVFRRASCGAWSGASWC